MNRVTRKLLIYLLPTVAVCAVFLLLNYDPSMRTGDDAVLPALGVETVLLEDDFESGDLAEFWRSGDAGSGRYEEGAVVVTNELAHSGERAVAITVREGDVAEPGETNDRAELDSGKQPLLGRVVRYRFAVRNPPDFPIVENRLVIAQIQQQELHNGPMIAQRFRGGRRQLTIRKLGSTLKWLQYFDLPDLEPGVWREMQYTIGYSTGADGFVQVRMNDQEVVRYSGVTAAPRDEHRFYHKFGLYRDRCPEPMTIYFDDYRVSEVERR